jgi:Holliday junction DNA helicase RuvA
MSGVSMIAYLSGTVHDVRIPSVIILANGIGFTVQIPAKYAIQKGAMVALEVYSHTTQDNGTQLFGFETVDEKNIFMLIISCSGLGPRIGLAILSALTPSLFVSAILTSDVKGLSGIEGIGPKKAESMIVQLKDKVSKLALDQAEMTSSAGNVKQLSDVLASLGYSRSEITSVLEHLRHGGLLQSASFDELVRKGLGFLAKKG